MDGGFLGGSAVKTPPANAGDTVRRLMEKIPRVTEQLSPCVLSLHSFGEMLVGADVGCERDQELSFRPTCEN